MILALFLLAQTTPPDWKVEVLARSPQLRHPTVVCAAPDGRVFVGEYPQDMEGPADAKIGRVLCVRPDGRVGIFADKLGAVFGLLWFDGKLYVHHVPKLTIYRDDDGVGRDPADLFAVTHPEPSRPHRYNTHIPAGIRLGVDGRLYLAVGDKGLLAPRLKMRGGVVVRFKPDGSELEVVATGTRNLMDLALTDDGEIFAWDNDDNVVWGARVLHIVQGGYYSYPWDRRWALFAMAEPRGIPAGDREEFRPVGIAVSPDGSGLLVADWNTAARLVKQEAGRLLKFTRTRKPAAAPKKPDPRRQAIRQLGTDALIAALADPDLFVRHVCASSLRAIGYTDVLGRALQDEKRREGALAAMRGMYDLRVVRVLADAGELDALAHLHRRDPPWNGSWWGARPALHPRPPKTVDWEGTPIVAAALENSTAPGALQAIVAAGHRGAIPALRSKKLSLEIIRALEALRDPELAALAAPVVKDPTRDDLLFAAAARHVVDPALLQEALRRETAAARLSPILDALGKGPVTAALPAHLDHADPEVRRRAVGALGRSGDPAAVEPLLLPKDPEATAAMARNPDLRALDAHLEGMAERNPELRAAYRQRSRRSPTARVRSSRSAPSRCPGRWSRSFSGCFPATVRSPPQGREDRARGLRKPCAGGPRESRPRPRALREPEDPGLRSLPRDRREGRRHRPRPLDRRRDLRLRVSD